MSPTSFTEGAQINVMFLNGNTANAINLSIDGGASYSVLRNASSNQTNAIPHWEAGSLITFTFMADAWMVQNAESKINIPICQAGSADPFKKIVFGTVPFDYKQSTFFPLIITNSNTYQGNLYGYQDSGYTRYPIYINDLASSATNYTLPAGIYLCYYDKEESIFYLRTDGRMPGQLEYLPLIAGIDYPLRGPLGLTENINYGSTLPSAGFEGQLFFLEENKLFLPEGGTEGQFLVKNSATNGDASWEDFPDLNYLPLMGGELTGSLRINPSDSAIAIPFSITNGDYGLRFLINPSNSTRRAQISYSRPLSSGNLGMLPLFSIGDSEKLSVSLPTVFSNTTASTSTTTGAITVAGGLGVAKAVRANQVYGAVWNDYAEYRICKEDFAPGQVVCENGDDTLSVSAQRLQPGANIISDTFGFAIGETEEAKCPVAVSGRVLAYPAEPLSSYLPGDPVCAGPKGTVSKMTREEVREYPDRIIGTVSAVPAYKTWGENNIPVNGRIWIKVK